MIIAAKRKVERRPIDPCSPAAVGRPLSKDRKTAQGRSATVDDQTEFGGTRIQRAPYAVSERARCAPIKCVSDAVRWA
jgi:hypothetical protein